MSERAGRRLRGGGRAVKQVRVNVMLPADLLEAIDRYVEAHGYSRSGFLALAARRWMEEA